MITDAQARLVGSLPADRWEQAAHRLEAFANAVADADPAIADLQSVGRAPSLGRIVRARRSTMIVRHAEHGGQPWPATRQAIRRREVANLVAEVRSRAGRELPDHALIAEVRRRCELEGLPVPSATTLRDAVADGGPVDLRIRFGRRFDLIVDACPLDIDVRPTTGGSEMAVLVTLQRSEDGAIVAHDLVAGRMNSSSLHDLLRRAALHREPSGDLMGTTPTIDALAEADLTRSFPGLRFDRPPSIGLAAGAAIRPRLGKRFGSVGLTPRRHSTGRGEAEVPLPLARHVLRVLIDEAGATVGRE